VIDFSVPQGSEHRIKTDAQRQNAPDRGAGGTSHDAAANYGVIRYLVRRETLRPAGVLRFGRTAELAIAIIRASSKSSGRM